MFINQTIINDITNNNIKQLYIRRKNIETDDLKYLVDLLKNNTSINLIDFTQSHIKNITPLLEFLDINKLITIMDFAECKIDNIEELFKYLTQTNNNILNTLEFYNCNINCSKEFLDFIKFNKIIKNINLSSNPLLNDSSFYDALKSSFIQELFLCKNNINDTNLIDIFNMLNINKSLKKLYLCSNHINNINSLNLKNNNSLISLDFSHNNINNIDILNDILKENDIIKEISFCDNKINNINEELNKIVKEKNIDLNINDNPINKCYKYYIVYYKYFDNENDYYNYICSNYKIYYYGVDIKNFLKNKEFNKNNLISILKFNSNNNNLTVYNINDDNLTYNIDNIPCNNEDFIVRNNNFIDFIVDLEDFYNDTSLQVDILNDYIKKNKNYNNKYFVVSIKHIYDFSENDIFKNNYSLI